MSATLIFRIAIAILICFLIFLFRKYLGRILLILLALAMICGIFTLINPNAAKSLFSSLTQLNTAAPSIEQEETAKNAEEYSQFASLFQQKSNQTLGNLIATGDETQLSGSKSTGDLTTLPSHIPSSNKTDPKTQEDIQLLSGIIASEKQKNQEQNDDFTRDENGSYFFDADRYEVGVIEGQLVIGLKENHEKGENTENTVPESLDEIIDTENTTITKVEKKSEGDQVITTITTKNVIKPASSSKLSAQDLREAQEIFGN